MARVKFVWMQGSCFAGSIRAMLAGYGGEVLYKPSKTIQGADVVLYTGGADIDPQLYGERRLGTTSIHAEQDRDDLACWNISRRAQKFQVGICRGMQFLNAMNGGKMWQHVDNHAGNNHLVQDVRTGDLYEVSSLHHQMCIPTNKAVILAVGEESTKKINAEGAWSKNLGPQKDIEALWYSDSRSLGVQWHPELGPKECVDLFFKYVERYQDIREVKEAA